MHENRTDLNLSKFDRDLLNYRFLYLKNKTHIKQPLKISNISKINFNIFASDDIWAIFTAADANTEPLGSALNTKA